MYDFNTCVTPESVGVESGAILAFLDRLDERGVELHGLVIGRHGKICYKNCRAPYELTDMHLMYSATKSVVSIAVGFAEQEGLLSLDDTLEEIYSDLEWENPNLAKATIRHLLTMSCGQETEIFAYCDNWEQKFLQHETPHEPGTHFFYNSTGVHLLCNIIYRKTGQQMMAFLRPRLLDPIGISQGAVCDAMPSDGTEIGGGGLSWTTEDFARFTAFLANRGSWNGQQLLNREWFDRACTVQIGLPEQPGGDDLFTGYGYLTWIGRDGAYMCNGMLGQFGMVFPALDAFVTTTANASPVPGSPNNASEIVKAVYECVIPGMKAEADTDDAAKIFLLYRTTRASIPAFLPTRMMTENMIAGKTYAAKQELPFAKFISYPFFNDNPVHGYTIRSLRFEFRDEECDLIFGCGTADGFREIVLTAARGGHFTRTLQMDMTFAGCFRWRSSAALELELRALEPILGTVYILRFGAEGRSFRMEADPINGISLGGQMITTEPWEFIEQ